MTCLISPLLTSANSHPRRQDPHPPLLIYFLMSAWVELRGDELNISAHLGLCLFIFAFSACIPLAQF